MSTASADPSEYTEGADRYVNFVEDFLDVQLAETQKEILRAVVENQRVLIVSGNGVGKSYGVAALILAFLYTNVDSTVMGTSGTYSQFIDTMWRPMKTMARRLHSKGMPGRLLEASPEVRVDDDWFAKVVSHKDPGNLEGRHADDILVVIEEADKKAIGQEHFDSAGSSVTDASDRMIAIANPPEDENNVVYEKMQSDRWHVVQFSSFASHNVRVDADLVDADPIPGLVGLPTMADDWEAWNDEPWPRAPEAWRDEFGSPYPGADQIMNQINNDEIARDRAVEVFKPGFDEVREAHKRRTELDERWYRRRAGVIPPDTAASFRPFSVQDVEDALISECSLGKIQGIGYDVARMGGDWNVISVYDGDAVRVAERWKGVDHNTNYELISSYVNPHRQARVAIDAQGEGSGVADRVAKKHDINRFNAGSEAMQSSKFYDKWTEGLYEFGQQIRNGVRILDTEKAAQELRVAARTLTFEEKFYSSRNSEVLKADPKSDVEAKLGRSPDVLDSMYMAVWAAETGAGGQQLTW